METALKVGQLAERAGLTVRTLHHYDEIGLLSPGRRTRAGHRLYGTTEVRRLQRIASLRYLGLTLDEIRGCLDRPGYSLRRVLELQIERIQKQMARQRQLRDLIVHLRDRIDTSGEASVDELIHAIEVTMNYEKYYTAEQMERLAARREEVGDERIQEVQEEWAEIFELFSEAMDQGLEPTAPEVQALARRSEKLVEEFTGGDAGIRDSLTSMYRGEGPEALARHGGMGPAMKPGLWEYMGKARGALAQ